MATKSWSAAFLDPALNFIKANSNKICLCSAEPTTYLGATDTAYLAGADLTSSDFTGPSDGIVSGRKLMIGQKSGITVAGTGRAQYLALVDTTSLALRYVGRVAPRDLILGSVIAIDAAIIEIRDPF